MAFSVIEVHEYERDSCTALLAHEDETLAVLLKCSYSEALALPPRFTAELDFRSVVRFEAGLPINDSSSGLFATDDTGVILADGSIHNHLEIGADHVLIDIYIQDGPEFLTVTSEELEGKVPEIGTRLKVWLRGVCIYPTHT